MEQSPIDPEQLDWLEEEFDSPAEVEAVFRSQRRLSLLYGGAFLAVTMAIPVLSLTSPFWNGVRVLGGFTLNYLVVTVIYHIIYLLIGASYALQANRLEQELLGRRHRQGE